MGAFTRTIPPIMNAGIATMSPTDAKRMEHTKPPAMMKRTPVAIDAPGRTKWRFTRNATPSKIEATKGYGAEVVLHGTIWDEANEKAKQLVEERGLTYIHPSA